MTRQRFFTVAGLSAISLAAVVVGVMVALRLTEQNGSRQNGSGVPVQFSQVEIGSLETRRTQTSLGDLNFVKRSSYRPTDQIGLRVRVESANGTPIQATVRLVDQAGLVQPLDPGVITLTPGTSGYCCWTIGTIGTYTLQLFRPDGSIISLPITIREQ